MSDILGALDTPVAYLSVLQIMNTYERFLEALGFVGPTFSNNEAQAAIMFDRHLGRHSLIRPNILDARLEDVGPTVSCRDSVRVWDQHFHVNAHVW